MDAKDEALAKRLGAAVRRPRTDQGLSQAALAERIGTSVEYVSMLERGARLPSVPTLVAVAKALGANLDALLANEASADREEDEIVALARSVPAAIRPVVTRMLSSVADPRPRYAASRASRRRRVGPR